MSNQFKKDLRKIKKRGKKLSKLNFVVGELLIGKSLDIRYRDHKLVGDYGGKMECHIEPDWLLIYSVDKYFLYLYRSGSRADLFV